MKLRLAFVLLSSAACASWIFAQGCGGDDASQGDASTDGTTGNDTGTPPGDSGKPNDSGPDTGTNKDSGTGNDSGAKDSGGGNDGSSSGLTFRCPDGGTATDCAQCGAASQPCVYCGNNDASVQQGRCLMPGSSCGANPPNNFDVCPCGNDASACPENYQVCRNGGCRTCGDSMNDNGLTCKSGGKCQDDAGVCK